MIMGIWILDFIIIIIKSEVWIVIYCLRLFYGMRCIFLCSKHHHHHHHHHQVHQHRHSHHQFQRIHCKRIQTNTRIFVNLTYQSSTKLLQLLCTQRAYRYLLVSIAVHTFCHNVYNKDVHMVHIYISYIIQYSAIKYIHKFRAWNCINTTILIRKYPMEYIKIPYFKCVIHCTGAHYILSLCGQSRLHLIEHNQITI